MQHNYYTYFQTVCIFVKNTGLISYTVGYCVWDKIIVLQQKRLRIFRCVAFFAAHRFILSEYLIFGGNQCIIVNIAVPLCPTMQNFAIVAANLRTTVRNTQMKHVQHRLSIQIPFNRHKTVQSFAVPSAETKICRLYLKQTLRQMLKHPGILLQRVVWVF